MPAKTRKRRADKPIEATTTTTDATPRATKLQKAKRKGKVSAVAPRAEAAPEKDKVAETAAPATSASASGSGPVAEVIVVLNPSLKVIPKHRTEASLLDEQASVWTKADAKQSIAGTAQASAPRVHGLFHASHESFGDHRDLVLRPDDFQLAIVQFVAKHVATDPSKYASVMGVKHEGKATITILHDGLVHGETAATATPKWAQVFPAFEEQITKACTDTPVLNALKLQFSTTQPVDRLVRRIALMDAYQSYFDYVVRTRCGIPRVVLKGTLADWTALLASISAYDALDLQWWTAPVEAVLSEIVKAYAPGYVPNVPFWNSIYKYRQVSGGERITGWMMLFAMSPSDGKESIADSKDWATHLYVKRNFTSNKLGSGLCKVPFVWDYHGTKKKMVFAAGFGLPHATDKSVEATVMWSVQDLNETTELPKNAIEYQAAAFDDVPPK